MPSLERKHLVRARNILAGWGFEYTVEGMEQNPRMLESLARWQERIDIYRPVLEEVCGTLTGDEMRSMLFIQQDLEARLDFKFSDMDYDMFCDMVEIFR